MKTEKKKKLKTGHALCIYLISLLPSLILFSITGFSLGTKSTLGFIVSYHSSSLEIIILSPNPLSLPSLFFFRSYSSRSSCVRQSKNPARQPRSKEIGLGSRETRGFLPNQISSSDVIKTRRQRRASNLPGGHASLCLDIIKKCGGTTSLDWKNGKMKL